MNFAADTRASTAPTAKKAISFISKGWREVKDFADADLCLIRAQANSFRKLATSIDRELENFINSAPVWTSSSISSSSSQSPLTMISSSASIPDLEFIKKIQPKLTEFRRAYSKIGNTKLEFRQAKIGNTKSTPKNENWKYKNRKIGKTKNENTKTEIETKE